MMQENKESFEVSKEKSLELRLGLPEENQPAFSISHEVNNYTIHGAKRGYQHIDETKTGHKAWLTHTQNHKLSLSEKPGNKTWCCHPFSSSSSASLGKDQKPPELSIPSLPQFTLRTKGLPVREEETTQLYKSKEAKLHCREKKASHKRIGVGPAVGWPPICSFRKNIATNNSPLMQSTNKIVKEVSYKESKACGNSLFVKINMDGVPIGRKVDLGAYDNYEKLSSAVDELFRGLLKAQRYSADISEDKTESTKTISGLLDGNGEYTLVYEDSEGDRMLVGDVPWCMFVSSAIRLRVLKKSELSSYYKEA